MKHLPCAGLWSEVRETLGFPGGSDGKVSVCNAGDPGLIPGLGRSPGEADVSPLWYSCLENPLDGERHCGEKDKFTF